MLIYWHQFIDTFFIAAGHNISRDVF